MGGKAQGARAAAADIDKTLGLLQTVVPKEGRVLNGQDQALLTTALHHRFLMSLKDMIHRHVPVRQQSAGCLLFGLPGEDHRQDLSRTIIPRTPHGDKALADTPIAVAAAAIRAACPVGTPCRPGVRQGVPPGP